MSTEHYSPPSLDRNDGKEMRIAIVQARFNRVITDRLVDGARAGLDAHGTPPDNIVIFQVPGSFELPLAAQQAARTGIYNAIICIGAIIRGETAHFEVVAAQTATGIAAVARREGVPVIFGVLTTDTMEQARARSVAGLGNSGWQAALGAIEMVRTLASIDRAASQRQA